MSKFRRIIDTLAVLVVCLSISWLNVPQSSDADGLSQHLPIPLPIAMGGTGTAGGAVLDGQIPIGNTATGKAAFNSITAGANITITPGAGTLEIAASASGVTSVTGTANQIDSTGGATPVLSLASTIILPGTSALRLQNGTTAQRPAGADGDLRFNTSIGTGMLEIFGNTAWRYIPSLVGTSLSDGDFVQWDTASSSFDNVPITGDATIASGGVLTLATVPIDKGGTNNAALGVSALGMYAGDGSKIIQVTGTALQQFRVNAGGTAIEAFTASAGGVTSLTGDGSFITNSGSSGAVTLTLGDFGNPSNGAGGKDTTSVILGDGAGNANNTAFGQDVYIGFNAGNKNTASNGVFIGYQAGLNNTSGANNTIIGSSCLGGTGAATDNVIIGFNAGGSLGGGDGNICIGRSANVAGNDCIVIGQSQSVGSGNNYTNIGGQIIRGAGDQTTVAGGTSGDYIWTMPERAVGYKRVIISFANYKNTGTKTITFPTAFARTPDCFIGGDVTTTLATINASTTTVTVPDTSAASATGTVTIEGM